MVNTYYDFWPELPSHFPSYNEILQEREFQRQERILRMIDKLAQKLKILNE
jgi:hypothetical protein